MNGDLLNNNNLVTETKKNTKFKISDPKCSNDLYGLPYKLEKNKKLDLNFTRFFILIYHQFKDPFKIVILKKGLKVFIFQQIMMKIFCYLQICMGLQIIVIF